jgi:hypothetical protein
MFRTIDNRYLVQSTFCVAHENASTMAAQVFSDEQSEHLAIEFRNGLTAAYNEIHREQKR